jgi:hypothetical protein
MEHSDVGDIYVHSKQNKSQIIQEYELNHLQEGNRYAWDYMRLL